MLMEYSNGLAAYRELDHRIAPYCGEGQVTDLLTLRGDNTELQHSLSSAGAASKALLTRSRAQGAVGVIIHMLLEYSVLGAE